MFTFLLLAGLFGAIIAGPTPEECPNIMAEAGLSEWFPQLVAHSIHSLTVEDIRYYFKPDVSENNGIPTVNMDLESDQRILPNAPLAGYDDDFSTVGLKSFDRVLRNMNRTWWGLSNYGVLDKVAHALHMSELWNLAVENYKYIEKLLDPESDICACVTDIENNDVLNYLNLLAFKIKYPGITSGNETFVQYYTQNLTASQSEGTHVRERREASPGAYRFGISGGYRRGGYNIWGGYRRGWKHHMRSLNFDQINFDLTDVELLRDVAEKLVDGEGVTDDKLDEDPANWALWKESILLPDDYPGNYDLAMFMFCMLNQ